MNLSPTDVQEIIRLLDDSEYDELEIETGSFRLVLRRGAEGRAGWSQQKETRKRPNIKDITSASPGAESGSEVPAAAEGCDPNSGETDKGLAAIRSPVIGTFYRTPQPGADPFVQPGSRVRPDTVVAIIEVMKLMNSVAAGMDGEVVEILAENGQLVQAGQCLMRVRPKPDTVGGPQG